MSRAVVTLRIDVEEGKALKNLSKIEGRPVNQLLNDAIKSYLRRQGEEERRLEATLKSLNAYRKKDSGYKRALVAFVEAEATVNDPLEGTPVEDSGNSKAVKKAAGPLQSKIQSVINA
jgi:hypothetical protein